MGKTNSTQKDLWNSDHLTARQEHEPLCHCVALPCTSYSTYFNLLCKVIDDVWIF